MIGLRLFAMLLVTGSAASAAFLPLRSGTYVQSGTPCKDPPFAAMFAYDGHQFSYPHATQCRSLIRGHRAHGYRVEETCSALGDGTPAAPTIVETSYIVRSATRVLVGRNGMASSSYRWCPPPRPNHIR